MDSEFKSHNGYSLGNRKFHVGTCCDHEAKSCSSKSLGRGILVFLFRAVLLLITLRSIPDKDSNILLLRNVFELVFVRVAYGVVSHVFGYTNSQWGLVTRRLWIEAAAVRMGDAVSGWAAVITASVLATSMAAGQMELMVCVPLGIILALILDPILIHWAWTSTGLAHIYDLQTMVLGLSYQDLSGCASIHIATFLLTIVAVAYMVKRLFPERKMNYSNQSVAIGSLAVNVLHSVMLMTGMIAICMPAAMNELTHEFGIYIGGNLSRLFMDVCSKVAHVFLRCFAPRLAERYCLNHRAIDIETGLLKPVVHRPLESRAERQCGSVWIGVEDFYCERHVAPPSPGHFSEERSPSEQLLRRICHEGGGDFVKVSPQKLRVPV